MRLWALLLHVSVSSAAKCKQSNSSQGCMGLIWDQSGYDFTTAHSRNDGSNINISNYTWITEAVQWLIKLLNYVPTYNSNKYNVRTQGTFLLHCKCQLLLGNHLSLLVYFRNYYVLLQSWSWGLDYLPFTKITTHYIQLHWHGSDLMLDMNEDYCYTNQWV